ncbi:hypothetical protein MIND_00675900 [Mycena indigotica]|uniref:Uncharacterized protein n=1 Tax=Mycena indigotica TaxID=2126181 RepID=A0A8H6SLP2_9AGAR|nr:uncharacterized protein MIND_00675900 [Mycena indigotica]KAF7301117.1 hypothetical protein MIND_00675900 [Mycena indigotica]
MWAGGSKEALAVIRSTCPVPAPTPPVAVPRSSLLPHLQTQLLIVNSASINANLGSSVPVAFDSEGQRLNSTCTDFKECCGDPGPAPADRPPSPGEVCLLSSSFLSTANSLSLAAHISSSPLLPVSPRPPASCASLSLQFPASHAAAAPSIRPRPPVPTAGHSSSPANTPAAAHLTSTLILVMAMQTKSLGRSSALIGGGPSPTGSRRSSLPIGLKIPVRITQVQEGLKRDLGMVREFANVVEELQVLQMTYTTLIDSLTDSLTTVSDEPEADNRSHRYSRLSSFPLLPRR